jgi:hypothetical protein
LGAIQSTAAQQQFLNRIKEERIKKEKSPGGLWCFGNCTTSTSSTTNKKGRAPPPSSPPPCCCAATATQAQVSRVYQSVKMFAQPKRKR